MPGVAVLPCDGWSAVLVMVADCMVPGFMVRMVVDLQRRGAMVVVALLCAPAAGLTIAIRGVVRVCASMRFSL